MELDTSPVFSPEAQEVFAEGCRVYAVVDTIVTRQGSEGAYLGRSPHGALVSWDTPDGNGFRESVAFGAIRNLYR